LSAPRESARAAFVTVLEDANLGVTVHSRMPDEGADERSVVLTIVSGSSRSAGVGLRRSQTKRGLELPFRIQIDCYYDDEVEVGKLADAVEQALMDAIDTLRTTYDIHGLRKVADVDTLRAGSAPLSHENRVLLDFSFFTHRELAT
jgi:hypothetical protein